MILAPAEIRSILDRAERRLRRPPPPPAPVAPVVDHTLLRVDAVPADLLRLCDEAARAGFAAVCVNPIHVRLCAERLAGTNVRVASVAGFPLGASLPGIKAMEAARAVEDGAGEIDAVQNVGALRSGEDEIVLSEVAALVKVCREGGAILKVILETASLDDAQKIRAARIAVEAGAGFVKTSTGFGPGGATPRDVAILREAVGEAVGVKASGGIRTLSEARSMIAAGASRLGTSAGMRLVEEESAEHARGPGIAGSRVMGSSDPERSRGA